MCSCVFCVCFFKQKTAYEMRISDWSSDVCSSDLARVHDKQALFYRLGRDDPIMGGLLLFHLLGVLRFRSFSHFHAPANAASVTPALFDLPHTRRQADAKAPVTTHPCGHSRPGSSLQRTETVPCPSPGPRQERPDAGRSPGSQVIA